MSRKKSFSPSPASETVAPLRSAIPSSYLPSRRAEETTDASVSANASKTAR